MAGQEAALIADGLNPRTGAQGQGRLVGPAQVDIRLECFCRMAYSTALPCRQPAAVREAQGSNPWDPVGVEARTSAILVSLDP